MGYIYKGNNEIIKCKNYSDLVDTLADFNEIDNVDEWVYGSYNGEEFLNRLEIFSFTNPQAPVREFLIDLYEEYYEGMEIAVEECIGEGLVEYMEDE